MLNKAGVCANVKEEDTGMGITWLAGCVIMSQVAASDLKTGRRAGVERRSVNAIFTKEKITSLLYVNFFVMGALVSFFKS